MDGNNPNLHNDPDIYQTGRTQPPKHYSGLVAFLIVLVILLSGISTALSIMNFKLYWQLNTAETTPQVAFSYMESSSQPAPAVYHGDEPVLQEYLGISGTVIPRVYQRYYKLPNGIYVTNVSNGSEASLKGLVVGDIILRINHFDIQDAQILDILPDYLQPGDPVELTLYRSGTEYSLSLIWGSIE